MSAGAPAKDPAPHRRNRVCAFLPALSLFFALSSASAHARAVTDATGTVVTVVDQPRRIVTLMPALGELAADLGGLGEDPVPTARPSAKPALDPKAPRIVGVSEYTDYPPALKKVASVGPYTKLSLETIAALKPDLVLASKGGNPRDQVLHLRELGLPVVVVADDRFDGIESSMRIVAQAMGQPEAGERMARQFRAGVEHVRERARARKGPKPKVMLQISDDPLVVAGGGSFLDQALDAVGAVNAFRDLPAAYPRPAREQVFARDPDLILVIALGDDPKSFSAMARAWVSHDQLKAVRTKRVVVLRADPLVRPSLRLLEGLSLLDQVAHGEEPHAAH